MRILFIDIDTLRADHMGCYGYRRRTTPNFDAVAAEGLRFDNYYCSDAPCLPSRAALVSGRFGIHTGAVGHGGTAADMALTGERRGFRDPACENNLFNIFRRAGFYTVSFSTFAERHSSYWFNAGLNETYNAGGGGMESGEEVLPAALEWLEKNAERDKWFMHFHLWDPHTPYRVPESWGNPFENEPLPEWLNEETVKKHMKHVGPHSINELNMYDDAEYAKYPRQPGSARDMAGLRRVIDGYDCGVSYADFLTGKLFDLLRERGVYGDTAVIITSDHGENLGELGIYSEHATADLPTCRIPMIIKWPGAKAGASEGGLHYNLDLCPTMAELLGTPRYKKWDGRSFAASLTAGDDTGRGYLVISQQAHVCQRSVRFKQWLYIRTYHDGYHLFPREMLFDIEADLYEQNDLAGSKPEVCGQAARLLLDWQDDMMKTSDSDIDPMWTVMREGGPFHTKGALDSYLARLDSTDRKSGADLLRRRYGDNGGYATFFKRK